MKHTIHDTLAFFHPYEVPTVILATIGAMWLLYLLITGLMKLQENFRIWRFMKSNNGTNSDGGSE